MTPIVETVARAICSSNGGDPDAEGGQGLRLYHLYYEEAQAAIAAVFDALETPSEGMINCGVGAIMNYPGGATITSRHEALKLAFPAMLVKAREEMLG